MSSRPFHFAPRSLPISPKVASGFSSLTMGCRSGWANRNEEERKRREARRGEDVETISQKRRLPPTARVKTRQTAHSPSARCRRSCRPTGSSLVRWAARRTSRTTRQERDALVQYADQLTSFSFFGFAPVCGSRYMYTWSVSSIASSCRPTRPTLVFRAAGSADPLFAFAILCM